MRGWRTPLLGTRRTDQRYLVPQASSTTTCSIAMYASQSQPASYSHESLQLYPQGCALCSWPKSALPPREARGSPYCEYCAATLGSRETCLSSSVDVDDKMWRVHAHGVQSRCGCRPSAVDRASACVRRRTCVTSQDLSGPCGFVPPVLRGCVSSHQWLLASTCMHAFRSRVS